MATSSFSSAQVAPATQGGGGGLHVFGEFTVGKPNYGTEYLLGPSLGGYLQITRWLGGEARGSILKWGPSPFHQDTALIGPRVQFPVHRFAPYGAFDIGVAHVTYPPEPGKLTSVNKLGWEMATGVDYHLTRRIDLRLFDFTYGKIYLLQNGLNPKTYSSGVVFSLF
ncbi:hypothetical protein [Acidobacterium sp. S8]|uniref:hypothetical protein n=1 Tax=Acidobacterium sp. S8 TaxID=1641854 RepID=UPI00131AA08E|nr:hypothetical protein [Acidobacterium sp. S8]